MKKIIYTLIFFCLLVTNAVAQKAIGQWNTYLSYYSTNLVAEGNNHVFGVANGSLYSYNKEDNSISYYSKQTGLSDNDINNVAFNPTTNTLLITYSISGNIDLLSDKGIYNLPYLMNNSNIQDKTINSIFIYNEYAYLSTNFGIMLINIDKRDITDTYKLNKKVYSVCIKDEYIYAATESGVIRAKLDSNLLDHNNWSAYSLNTSIFNSNNIRKIVLFQNNLCFFVQNSGIYYQSNGQINIISQNNQLKNLLVRNEKLITYTGSTLYIYSNFTTKDAINVENINDVTSGKDANTFWIATGINGIKGIKKSNEQYTTILENTNNELYSPKRNYNYFMTIENNQLYIVGGGRNSDRLNIPGTLMIYNGNEWFNLDENEVNKEVNKQFPENNFIFTTKDYTGIAVDPKDPTHYFVSAYGEGVLEFRENKFVKLYNHTNSTISPALNKTTEQQFTYNRIGSLTFDKEGNLWMTNCEIDDGSIKVLKADGTWISLIHDKLNHAYQADKILIASNNRKWINSPSPIGIFVLDDKGTIDDVSDDEFDSFTIFKNNNESIEAAGFYCVTEDKNGQIWIGTNRGPVYCLNSKAEISKLQFSRVIRPLEDGNGEGYAFLDGEQINAIAVDGGNRKWIGTQSSGVFLVSEDGMETISNFTTANSPLPSNQVNTLAINQQTGEVFIGTEKGLVSYMGDATEGSEDYSDIYAYPNPVRPEQNDRVTIVGLMNDSNVKITDLKGNIIYQGKSVGGTFTWDCRRKGGGRVATGIYLVLSATPEAKESVVTKIMVVK